MRLHRCFVLSALLVACGGNEPSTVIDRIVITPLDPVLPLRGGLQLIAEARLSDGSVVEGAIFTWSSSDAEIASVTGAGFVFGRAEGTATITATTGDAEGTTGVVVQVPVGTLTVAPAEATVIAGATQQLTVTAVGVDDEPIVPAGTTWAVNDPLLGQVDEEGLVTTLEAGTLIVTATFRGVSADAQLTILPAVASVELWEVRSDEPGVRLEVIPIRASEALRAIARDHDGQRIEGRAVTWSSSNPAALTVDAGGLVRAVGEGSAEISAVVDGVRSNLVPLSVLIMPPILQLATGESRTCAVAMGGDAYCWGNGFFGSGETIAAGDAPVRIAGGHEWSQVSVGGVHTCGLTTAGVAWCWGRGPSGQLGDGTSGDSPEPTPVLGSHVFRFISAGGSHTCAITTAGETYCWGAGVVVPTLLPGSFDFQAISIYPVWLAPRATCGITTGDKGLCWGSNDVGNLGTGDSTSSESPTPVVGGHEWSEISAGRTHSCGVTTSGAAFCWGDNFAGAFGNGTFDADPRPIPVNGGLYAAIGVGHGYTCAIRTDATLACFGDNGGFQLGIEGPVQSEVPVSPAPGLSFATIRTGSAHACALTFEGIVYCWGGMGNGADTDFSVSTPTKVVGQR
jgi:alpha-tubulin suppressor-like RCC1 family protein